MKSGEMPKIPGSEEKGKLFEDLYGGKFSPMSEERKRIRENAIKQGKDPDEAVRIFEEEMREATQRLNKKTP